MFDKDQLKIQRLIMRSAKKDGRIRAALGWLIRDNLEVFKGATPTQRTEWLISIGAETSYYTEITKELAMADYEGRRTS